MKIDKELARKMTERALEGGAREAEVFMRFRKGVSAESRDLALESAKTSADFGFAVRVIAGRKLGFSYSTDPEYAFRTVDAALEAAKYTEEDRFLAFPDSAGTAQCLQIYDAEVKDASPEEALERAIEIESACMKADPRIKRVRSATASFATEEVYIHNSHGVHGLYVSTSATGQVMAVAEEGGDSQMGWEFMGSAFLKDVDFRKVGERAARKALMMLGAGKTESLKAPVVLDSSISAEFLEIFSSMLSADSVQKGKSLLRDKIGEEVINPAFSIIDDGTLPKQLGTKPFDDEGVPTSRKALIEKGVLKGFMHNTYTAKKAGARSTGNAIKAGMSTTPSVGHLNLYLSPETETVPFDRLIGLAGRGLYIIETMGMHTANPISGEFSIGVSGVLIENGRLTHPVKEAVISGNILGFFEKAQAAADDFRFYGTLGSPSILIGSVDISA